MAAIAYYRYHEIERPEWLVARHREILGELGGRGRIYLSQEGINAQLSLPRQALNRYGAFVQHHHAISQKSWNVQPLCGHIFPRLTVKVRRQLVALDQKVQLDKTAYRLEPREWARMLSERSNGALLLDVRNKIEWDLGHFEGAVSTGRSTFREFEQLDRGWETVDSQTPILMYCTGGIRCECYSALLRERGYQNLYQLRGGILNYIGQMGSLHWIGRVFVFDDRLSLGVDGDHSPCARCHRCGDFTSRVHNCANMDCNALFFSCESCWREKRGCCRSECQGALRVRPLSMQSMDRPFGKWYSFANSKAELNRLGPARAKAPSVAHAH